jgi:hypothetical protein
MPMRVVVGYAALVAAFSFAAIVAQACEEVACLYTQDIKPAETTKPAAAPLKPNTFARRKMKATHGTAVQRIKKSATALKVRKRAKAVKRAAVGTVARDAPAAPAFGVRVVLSDELNEIDRRADSPALESGPMSFAAEPLRPTRVSVANIARKPKPNAPAKPIAITREPEAAAEPPSASDNWAAQLWTMLQSRFYDIATAFRRQGE